MIPKRVTGKIRQQKNHSGNFDFFQKGTLEKYYKHRDSAYLIGTEPFLSTLQEVLFHQALNISLCWLDFSEELPPHAKNDEFGYWRLQILFKNLYI